MKTSRTGHGIALVILVPVAVLQLITGHPHDAIAPGLMAAVLGVTGYQEWRRALRSPKAWTRRRTTVTILVAAPVSIVALATFAWIGQQDAWPNPVLGWVGVGMVVAVLVRFIFNARREDRLARQATKQGTPTT